MPKARVHELARDLGVDNKEIIAYLAGLGADVKNHMSLVDERFAELARRRFAPTTPIPGVSAVQAIKPRPAGMPPRNRRRRVPPGSPAVAPGPSAEQEPAPSRPAPEETKAPAAEDAAQTVAVQPQPAPQPEPQPVPPAAPVTQPAGDAAPAPKKPRQAGAQRDARKPGPREAERPHETAQGDDQPARREGAQRSAAPATKPAPPPRAPEESRPAARASGPAKATGGGRPAPHAPKKAAPQDNRVDFDVEDDEDERDGGRRRKGAGKKASPKATVAPAQGGKGQQRTAARPGSAPAGTRPGGRTGANRPAARKPAPAAQAEPAPPVEKGPKIVEIGDTISVAELAEKLGVPAVTVIKQLMTAGVMAAINNVIDFDVAAMVCEKLDALVEHTKAEKDHLLNAVVDSEEQCEPRPPVVTILGHVDHGKTTLLDAIRETRVVETEAGGITQHIGAYQVEKNGRLITFLDTPGHEAFTEMRSRGAQVTDVAVLVVAADDGVMPQTIEALNHAKAAEVPIIVAINKIDRPGANPDRVKQQLADHGLLAEDWGGDTVMVEVSALKKLGIEDLLEMILLVADLRDLKANPNRPGSGTVIEAELDKARGAVATVLVQNGTLRTGDAVVAGSVAGRVRAMFDYRGRPVKAAGPSMPVSVLGLDDVPQAGDLVEVLPDERTARQVAEERASQKKAEAQKAGRLRLSELYAKMQEGEVKDLRIVLKADVQGSVEALTSSLEKLSTDEVRVSVIHGGTGGITESDVALAAASNAIIIGFNVRPEPATRRAADREGIDIRLYRIIYEAIDDVKAAMTGLLEPTFEEVVLGRAEVRATFRVPNVGVIAGAYVTDGKIVRNASVRVLRDNVVIYEGKIASLKRFKDDVREVNEGYECGIGIERFNDVKEGDVIEAYQMQEVKA